jgi:hypothetical protein
MSLRPARRVFLVPAFAAAAAIACGNSEPTPTPAAPTPVPAPATAVPAAPAAADPAASASAEAEAKAPEAAQATADAPIVIPGRAPAPDRVAKRPADDPRNGRFSLDRRAPRSKKLRVVAGALKDAEVFPELIGALNETLLLPADVSIGFEYCDEVHTSYDPEARRISLFWELIADSIGNFERESEEADEAIAGALNATLFTVFHELGHALVDVLDLPITGREEDAVDQLATWILLSEGSDEGALMALDGAASFRHDAENEAEEGDEPVTWGEHGLNEQRFYNILCWVYGHAPDKLGAILESNDGPLPDDRAEQCEDEYKRLDTAWTKLLEPHVVPD